MMNHQERLEAVIATLRGCMAEVNAVGDQLSDRSVRCILGMLWLATDEIKLALGQSPDVESPL